MKCAHAVALCTGSLRLLHQPRSPAVRLVSSQVGVKGVDVKNPVLGIPAPLSRRFVDLRHRPEKSVKKRAQLARAKSLTRTCNQHKLVESSGSRPKRQSPEKTRSQRKGTGEHVMSLLRVHCAFVVAVKWYGRSGNYRRIPCVHDGRTTTIHEVLLSC